MSTTDTDRTDVALRVAPVLDTRPVLIATAMLFIFVTIIRAYEHVFGWKAGLDSFSPEFQSYWMLMLLASVPINLLTAAALIGYLWRTRERDFEALAPAMETRRLIYLVEWLVVFALALYFGLSFFSEQTAVWHMTAVRDTDFTPSNIITFYISYPLFSILGIGAFFYAKTRLPSFAKGYSLPFVVLVVGVFMTIPNVGFNEWGHTFWAMDEGFAGPLHWGFVFFGWMSLAVFGVVLQILSRLRELIGVDGVKLLLQR